MSVEATENAEQIETAVPVDQVPVPDVVESGTQASEQPGKDADLTGAGSGTESASSPGSWLDDQHRELGKSYGFSDDEISEFKSAEEFARATRILDKQIANFGQAAIQALQPQQNQQQTQTAKTVEQPAAPAPTAAKLSKIDEAKLKAAGWDDETIAEFAKVNPLAEQAERLQAELAAERAEREAMKSQFTSWQQSIAQQQAQQEAYDFHTAVDALNDQRFGKTFDASGRLMQLTNEQHALRAKLYEAKEQIALGHMARNVPPPPMPLLVKRANNYAFADDIRAEERRRVQSEIAEQAKKRRPVAQQRTAGGQFSAADKVNPFNLNEYVQAVANSPELVAKWNQYQQENGQTV